MEKQINNGTLAKYHSNVYGEYFCGFYKQINDVVMVRGYFRDDRMDCRQSWELPNYDETKDERPYVTFLPKKFNASEWNEWSEEQRFEAIKNFKRDEALDLAFCKMSYKEKCALNF